MSFYTSLSGLQAAQTDMSTISHNLANVSTNGFKRSSTQFADVIASTKDSNPTLMVGSGTVVKSIRQQFSQGGFTQSSSALDLAISGESFVTSPGPLSDLVVDAARAITGLTPDLSTTGGTSDARFIQAYCPVIEFGLVGETMHKVDERVALADLARLQAIYTRVLEGFFAQAG